MAAKNKVGSSAKVPEKAETGPKFTIEKLKQNCLSIFGVSTSTFVGATYGMTGKYTVEEMKTHIETWKKEAVK